MVNKDVYQTLSCWQPLHKQTGPVTQPHRLRIKKKQRTNCNITAVINSWRCSTEYSRRQVPAVAMQRRARAGRAIKINDCSLLIVTADRASLARQAVDDRRRPTTGLCHCVQIAGTDPPARPQITVRYTRNRIHAPMSPKITDKWGKMGLRCHHSSVSVACVQFFYCQPKCYFQCRRPTLTWPWLFSPHRTKSHRV